MGRLAGLPTGQSVAHTHTGAPITSQNVLLAADSMLFFLDSVGLFS